MYTTARKQQAKKLVKSGLLYGWVVLLLNS